jgi:peroxiredoxin
MADLAIILVGILSLFNLFLTLTVVRYLRRVDEQTADRTRPVKTVNSNLLQPGTQIPEFATVTLAGDARTLSGMAGAQSLVGFFSAHCPSCVRQAPEFRSYANARGFTNVLAVIISPDQESAADLREELAYAVPTVIEAPRGAVSSAFSVSTYPAIFVLDEGGRIQECDIAVRNIAARVGHVSVLGGR